MSINNNCLEYLLGVAEKIIDSYADQAALSKYYKLKESMKYQSQSHSRGILGSSINRENITDRFRQSIAFETSSCLKRQNSRKSMRHSVKNRSSKELQRCRLDTFGSKTVKKQQQPDIQEIESISVLEQLASLLKNAQACPNLLKTIAIAYQAKDLTLHKIIKSIESSLSIIHKALTERTQGPSQFLAGPTIPVQEAIKDNKWLVSKLQGLINENTTLRRMVGSKLY